MTTPKYTEICSDFIQNLSFADLPEKAINQIKMSLFDLFANIIRARQDASSIPARKLVTFLGGNAQAAIVGETEASTILNAAFYHGYLGHIMSMDDVERFSIVHPAIIVIPAALAVGELRKKNGRDMIVAAVAGYEIMSRIGSAINPAHYAIFHTTSTTGSFGAAAAAGKLFDLQGDSLKWALGNAGTMTAGLWQYLQDGAMSKFLHPGRASVNGVLAAYLASEGFSGPTRILEGTQGFFAGYARQDINPKVFADLGKHFRTTEITMKPYPCCRHLHSAVDAVMVLNKEAGGTPVKRINIQTYDTVMRTSNVEKPETVVQARFSMRYIVARTHLNNGIKEADFTEAEFRDPKALELMQRINVTPDDALSSLMPKYWPCRMEFVLEDGRTLQKEILSPKGDPDVALSWDEVIEKFGMMTEGILSQKDTTTIADLCKGLDAVGDVSMVIKEVNRLLLRNA